MLNRVLISYRRWYEGNTNQIWSNPWEIKFIYYVLVRG